MCDGAYEDARGVYVALEEGTFQNPKGAKLTAGEKGVWGRRMGGEQWDRTKAVRGVRCVWRSDGLEGGGTGRHLLN